MCLLETAGKGVWEEAQDKGNIAEYVQCAYANDYGIVIGEVGRFPKHVLTTPVACA